MNAENDRPAVYGIRVSVDANDPFARLVDDNWSKTHWFESRTERDMAMEDMSREHEYSRRGDKPTLIYEAIEREAGTH